MTRRPRRPAQTPKQSGRASSARPRTKWNRKTRRHDPKTLEEWRQDPRYPGRVGSNYVPNAVQDSARGRTRRALNEGGKYDQISALIRLYGGVSHYIVRLRVIAPESYYTVDTAHEGREAALAVLQQLGSQGSWMVRVSRQGVLHVHLVARTVADVPPEIWSRPMHRTEKDQLRLAAYLVGPMDEAAWRPDLQTLMDVGFDREQLAVARVAAADRWLLASHDAYQDGRDLPDMAAHNIARETMRAVKAARAAKVAEEAEEELAQQNEVLPSLGSLLTTAVGDQGGVNPLHLESREPEVERSIGDLPVLTPATRRREVTPSSSGRSGSPTKKPTPEGLTTLPPGGAVTRKPEPERGSPTYKGGVGRDNDPTVHTAGDHPTLRTP